MSTQPNQHESGQPNLLNAWNAQSGQQQGLATAAAQQALAPRPNNAPTPARAGAGPVGTVRSNGVAILLFILTLGFYGLYWNFSVHCEMKRHTGQGIGGGLALLLSFVPLVMTFLTPSEAGGLYRRQGRPEPVSAVTGLWTFLPLIGALVWFIKTNNAINEYWRSVGAA